MSNKPITLADYIILSPLSKENFLNCKKSHFLRESAKVMETPLFQILSGPSYILTPEDYRKRADNVERLEKASEKTGHNVVIRE
jgi:hypothetical protein